MISASDRENAVLLINEAIKLGASCKKACERLGITERTFYRVDASFRWQYKDLVVCL